jgi:hypothetical protein
MLFGREPGPPRWEASYRLIQNECLPRGTNFFITLQGQFEVEIQDIHPDLIQSAWTLRQDTKAGTVLVQPGRVVTIAHRDLNFMWRCKLGQELRNSDSFLMYFSSFT